VLITCLGLSGSEDSRISKFGGGAEN
jgi:hypothetical protein